MQAKNNSDQECNSRFCAVNTYATNQPAKKQPPPFKVTPQKAPTVKVTPQKPRYDASNNDNYSSQKLVPVDRNQLNRNRQLREQLDAKRELDLQSTQLKETIVPIQIMQATGPPEAIKMRLLVIMGKFRDLNFEYKHLSQYFEACFKRIGLSEGDAAVLETFLIFDKIDLADSDNCYAVALKGIEKAPTTRYAKLSSVIDGLAALLKDLQ
jgi:hypothetical protein